MPEQESDFLDLACLTYAGTDNPERPARAAALLAADPTLGERTLAAAAVAGRVDIARSLVAADPAAATTPSGPRNWEPLLYLTFGRVDTAHAPEIAALLIAAGADPNTRWQTGDGPTPFTPLTGALGSGEQDQTEHPSAIELARVLLAAGADPVDEQVLYNRMFSDSDAHLRLLLEFGLADRPQGREQLRQQLIWACAHDRAGRVALIAGRGIDLTSPLAIGYTPLEIAVLTGSDRARRALGGGSGELDPALHFVALAFAGDRDGVEALPDGVVAQARIRFPALVLRATAADRPDAVDLLAELGFDVDARGRADLPIDEPWETALHHAAGQGNLAMVTLLLELGADAGQRDLRFEATPAEWAAELGHPEAASLIVAGVPTMVDEEMLAEFGIDLGELDFDDPDPAGPTDTSGTGGH